MQRNIFFLIIPLKNFILLTKTIIFNTNNLLFYEMSSMNNIIRKHEIIM